MFGGWITAPCSNVTAIRTSSSSAEQKKERAGLDLQMVNQQMLHVLLPRHLAYILVHNYSQGS